MRTWPSGLTCSCLLSLSLAARSLPTISVLTAQPSVLTSECSLPYPLTKRKSHPRCDGQHKLVWFIQGVCVHVLSCARLFVTPWTVTCQVPLSMGFSRQEHWSGCHFLLQGIFPTQGSNSSLLHLLYWQTGALPAEPTGNPIIWDKIQIPILQNGTPLSVLLKSYYFHQLQSQTKISNTFKIHQSTYQKSKCWGLPNSWLGWDDSILTAVSQFGKLVVSVFPHTQSLGPYQWQAFKVRFKVFTVVLTVLKSRSTSHCLTFMWVWSLSEPSKVALCCMLSRFSCVWLSATLWTIYSPPGSSVHGVLQARILVWVAMPGSRGSSQLRDQTHVSYISCIGRWVFTTSTIWKAQGGSGFTYKSSPVVELLPWTIIRSLTKVVYYLHTAYNAIRVGCLELFYSNHLRRKP